MCVMAHGGRGGDERDMSLEKNLSRNDVGLPFGTLTYYNHNLLSHHSLLIVVVALLVTYHYS